MTTLLSKQRLSDGTPVDVLLVTAPDGTLSEDLVTMLAHKGEPWLWHLRQCLEGMTPGLETRFYLAEIDGVFAGNVTVFENGALQNVSHVFTQPEFRGRGVAALLVRAALEDSDHRGAAAQVLNAGFQGVAWRLYEKHGFSGICPEQRSGGMVRWSNAKGWDSVLQGLPGHPVPADWQHFVGQQILFGRPDEEQLRSLLFPAVGPCLSEGEFLRFMHHQSQDGERRVHAWALPGAGAWVLGFALVGPHPLWGNLGRRAVLDLCLGARGWERGAELVRAALAGVDRPVECYCDSASTRKQDLLESCGFREEARAPEALDPATGRLLDIVTMARC